MAARIVGPGVIALALALSDSFADSQEISSEWAQEYVEPGMDLGVGGDFDSRLAPSASPFYWDTSDTTGLQAGSGTWSVSSLNWNPNASGTGTRAVWADNSDAFFETSGMSTITISDTVQVNSITFDGAGYTISGGPLTLTGPNITTNQDATITSAIDGTLGLTKLGAGTLTVNADNTIYDGNTTIQNGTLATTTGNYLGSSGSTIFINAGTLRYDATYMDSQNNIQVGSSTSTIDVSGSSTYGPGAIGGSGSLTKNGTGTLQIDVASTFTGGFTANAGLTHLSVNGALAAVSSVTIASSASMESPGSGTTDVISDSAALTLNGTLDVSGGTETLGSLAGASTGVLITGDFDVYSGSVTIGDSNSTTYSGVITGSRTAAGAIFTKQGTGTLVLSGANTYVGMTAINNGTLQVASTETAGTSGPLGKSGTISFGGGTLQYSASNTFDYSSRFSTAASQQFRIDTNGQNLSFASALSSSGGSLTKLGNGMLTLTNASDFYGTTTINGGTLRAATNSLLSVTGPITVNNGGTLLLSGAGQHIGVNVPMTLNGGTFNTAGLSESLTGGALTLSSTSIIDLATGASILRYANSSAQTWSGTLNIYNWSGTPLLGNGTDQVYFGTNALGLTTAQLAEVSFYSDSGSTFLGNAIFGPDLDGEIIPLAPVPEPSTWFAAALAFGAAAYTQLRKRSRAGGRRLRGLVRAAKAA